MFKTILNKIFNRKSFSNFIQKNEGQGVVEYIVILALILVVLIIVFRNIGNKGKAKGSQVENALS